MYIFNKTNRLLRKRNKLNKFLYSMCKRSFTETVETREYLIKKKKNYLKIFNYRGLYIVVINLILGIRF